MALNSLVTICRRVDGVDAHGQATESWQTVMQLYAEVRHLSGVETIKAGAEVSAVRASIKVRRRDGITPAMQVLHAGRRYDIEAVLPDDIDRLHMHLVCVQGIRDGR